jgi:hypothetical protein
MTHDRITDATVAILLLAFAAFAIGSTLLICAWMEPLRGGL